MNTDYVLAFKAVTTSIYNKRMLSCFVQRSPILCVEYKLGKVTCGVDPRLPLFVAVKKHIHIDPCILDISCSYDKILLVKIPVTDTIRIKHEVWFTHKISHTNGLSIKQQLDDSRILNLSDHDKTSRFYYYAHSVIPLEIIPDNTNLVHYIVEKEKQYNIPFWK